MQFGCELRGKIMT